METLRKQRETDMLAMATKKYNGILKFYVSVMFLKYRNKEFCPVVV